MTQEQFDGIIDRINRGYWVYICAYCKAWKTDLQNWNQWLKYGHPLLRLKDGQLQMAHVRKNRVVYDTFLDGTYSVKFKLF